MWGCELRSAQRIALACLISRYIYVWLTVDEESVVLKKKIVSQQKTQYH